jgi:hypothetical protein
MKKFVALLTAALFSMSFVAMATESTAKSKDKAEQKADATKSEKKAEKSEKSDKGTTDSMKASGAEKK